MPLVLPRMNIINLSLKKGTPASGYWDMAFINDLLDGLPESNRTVFIIPGAYQSDVIDEINAVLSEHPKVLVFITSDEEGKFPIHKLKHPDMEFYSQYGTSANMIPLGYTPETRKQLKRLDAIKKNTSFFFSGQINHVRRKQMADALRRHWHYSFFETDGFAKGMNPEDYYSHMALARVVPCPPGNQTQDSFRLYEALEAGAVPIVDRFSAQGNGNYWERLFPDAPFPVLSRYSELVPLIQDSQSQALRNKVFAWWIKKKMQIKNQIKEQLDIHEAMTVVIPTSLIPSHPSTYIIDQTIQSIRHNTAMDIILTIDGIRSEQESRRADYEEYIRRLLWKCNFEYENVSPVLFEKHVHQSGMMKAILPHIKTPLLLYVEHDTPLVTDEDIPWGMICETIFRGDAHAIRLHFEAKIPKEHEHLMVHEKDIPFFTATKQWSQRPHVARTKFYREIIKFFSDESNCFIEDRVYGKCLEGDWEDWKLYIYTPPGNIKRSLNLDGRGSDYKFEREQIW